MATKTPTQQSLPGPGILPAKLSTLFTHEFRDADAAPLWRRFHAAGSRGDRDALFEFYAPWVGVLAWRRAQRRPEFYCEADLDDMRADGCLGLLEALGSWEPGKSSFPYYSAKLIGWFIRRGRQAMFGGRRAARRENIIAEARAQLIQQHGRLPLADELTQRLRGVLTNPNFQIGHADTISLSVNADGDEVSIDPVDTREVPAICRAMSGEAMKLAMKGMRPDDRKLFKLAMKGIDQTEIARRFGVSKQRIGQRLNGVLWELRSRADLAEYLGVQPENPPAGFTRQDLPSPAKFPPAQRAG